MLLTFFARAFTLLSLWEASGSSLDPDGATSNSDRGSSLDPDGRT